MENTDWTGVLIAAGYLLGIILAGAGAARTLIYFLEKWSARTAMRFDDILVRRMRGPLLALAPVVLYFVVTSYYRPPALESAPLAGAMRFFFVGIIAWMAIRTADIACDMVQSKFDVSVADNRVARRIHTQISILRRVTHFVIFLIGVAAVFMMSESLRGFGVSLLASAGVAGLIIGFSAQKVLGNLLAGIQIALTQPVSIDDVVIVEGEWGRIEEITLTYVVVRIWDLRRLVLPISYFIEKPFQNWTRTSADILGTVSLYLDYTVPVAAIRTRLAQILETKKDLWDGKVSGVQVVNATPDTVEVRVLVSAANSGDAWNLRCALREELIDFVQKEYPGALPVRRARLMQEGETAEKENRAA